MTDEENKVMERYGITYQTSSSFHFAEYRYKRLEDAISYAKNNQHLLKPITANAENKS